MTINDEVRELLDTRLSQVDDKILEIIDHIKSGDYSDSLIVDELNLLRKKVW